MTVVALFRPPTVTRRKRRSRTGGAPDPLGVLYPTLDLHGLTASEAVAATRSWLEVRRLESDLTVRVVTGRGLHSVGPAVLPGEIEDLLKTLRGSFVAGFEREPGGGVYRVRLHPSRPRAPSPVPPPVRDPALIREAEESLADLGIQPTPALVNEEIRRILRERSKGAE